MNEQIDTARDLLAATTTTSVYILVTGKIDIPDSHSNPNLL